MPDWSPIFAQPPVRRLPSRKVFFSFHYKPDVHRAFVVRNSWLTKDTRAAAGFFDSSVFESKQRISNTALKLFLRNGLIGTSVTCVLIGATTALRPWVRYEIVRSFHRGNGMLGIRIHQIKNLKQNLGTFGLNPFDCLAYRVVNDRVFWQQHNGVKWVSYDEVPSLPLDDVTYDLNRQYHHTFACRFNVYDWVNDNGYQNLGTWIQRAATQAGK